MTRAVKAYYWKAIPNFGDALTALILKKYTRLECEWAEPKDAELVMVGSVLDVLPKDWSGVIAGAGKLHEKTASTFPNARVLAVRGPLSARGMKGYPVLADPGLMIDDLIRLEDKEYNLGIIPHWTDKTLEHDPRFKKFNPKIIRVSDDPIEVIKEIGRCKKIVSSSLHGIIAADAFAIPRRIEISPRALERKDQEGGLFKWQDYSASLGMELEIGLTQDVDRNKVVEKQHELYDVFGEIKGIFKENLSS